MIARWTGGVLAAGLALGAAACGSAVSVEGSGGAGGAGTTTTTTGSGGAGGVIPPECAVQASDPGPYPVTFQLENSGAQTVYVLEACGFQFSAWSCEDGYTEALALDLGCTGGCNEPGGGCVACEPCWSGLVAVTPGSQMSEYWQGYRYTLETNASGCTCNHEHVARAGRYRITVPVHTSPDDVSQDPPAYEVTVDFELPAPDGVVVVPIGQSP